MRTWRDMEGLLMGKGHPIEIQYYRAPNGKQSFTEWFESIRDKNTQNRIDKRLERLEDGNFGDCQSVGGGVFELRLHFGPGYRIYFGQIARISHLFRSNWQCTRSFTLWWRQGITSTGY